MMENEQGERWWSMSKEGVLTKLLRHAMRVGGILWPYFSIRVVTLQLSIIQVEVEEKRVMQAYIKEQEE